MELKNGKTRNDISPELLVMNKIKGMMTFFVGGSKADGDAKV